MLNSLILLVCFIRGSPPLGEVVLIKMAADGTPLGDKEKRQHGRLSKLQNAPWYQWYPKRVWVPPPNFPHLFSLHTHRNAGN